MTTEVGPVKLGSGASEMFVARDMNRGREFSEAVAETVDAQVRALIEQAHNEAYEVISANRDILDTLARELLEKETLDHNQIAEIFTKVRKIPERTQWLSSEDRPVSQQPPIEMPVRIEAGLVASQEPDATAAVDATPEAAEVDGSGHPRPATA